MFVYIYIIHVRIAAEYCVQKFSATTPLLFLRSFYFFLYIFSYLHLSQPHNKYIVSSLSVCLYVLRLIHPKQCNLIILPTYILYISYLHTTPQQIVGHILSPLYVCLSVLMLIRVVIVW